MASSPVATFASGAPRTLAPNKESSLSEGLMWGSLVAGERRTEAVVFSNCLGFITAFAVQS